MRRPGRVAAAAATDPARPVEEGRQHGYDQKEDIEVLKFGNIVGVQEAFPVAPVAHYGHDFIRPGEFDQDENHEYHQQRVTEEALDRVSDDDRQRAAHADDRDRRHQNQHHQKVECREVHSGEVQRVGQVQKVDEKARRQCRHDHVGQHFRQTAETRRKDPEFPAVTHFEELAQTLRLGFPEAVGAISEQTHQYPDRQQDHIPEGQRKPGFVMNFDISHQPQYRQRRRDIAD
ncbi:hypothetical protein SDC9_167382 [bioreactor metagenome]|uniref:Uncharacterized protein n=1 Tax=bioreactor metagenome TaxID=1076179 RepID=A0A645G1G9_9ZZZZ